MNVELVRWPSEHHRREELVAAGVARLLLVETDVEAPCVHDPLEDWVRLPVDSSDLQARLDTLRARSRVQASAAPRLDTWGVLHFRGCEVCLAPLEARLAALLVGSFGAVVRRGELIHGGWPAADPGRNALDVHILRLRRRLDPLGLSIRTVRNRGYMLAPAMPAAPSVRAGEIGHRTRTNEAQSTDPRSTDPRSTDPRSTDPRSTDTRITDTRFIGSRVTDHKGEAECSTSLPR